MVEFVVGMLVGGTVVAVILGLHFVKLIHDLREKIISLQVELRHLR